MLNAELFYRHVSFSYLSSFFFFSSFLSPSRSFIFFLFCSEWQRFQRVKRNEWLAINIKVGPLIFGKKEGLSVKRRGPRRCRLRGDSHQRSYLYVSECIHLVISLFLFFTVQLRVLPAPSAGNTSFCYGFRINSGRFGFAGWNSRERPGRRRERECVCFRVNTG